jgi:hypothetical protein
MSYKNYSLDECARGVAALKRQKPNATFFQKWTCAKCGDRVTGNTPDKLFTQGHHEDCGHITDITKTGCNYAVHFVIGGIADMEPKGSA